MNSPATSTHALPRFGVVLVNYKTHALTRASLELLRTALAGYDAEVWVVDNDSADESTAYLRSLDWIRLIERQPTDKEPGFVAHGRALDAVLQQIRCDYLFLLHTDTMIYDASVFSMMLGKCLADERTFVVGCLEQIDRGHLRSTWRIGTRFLKHHFRRLKLALGMASKPPKPYRETYVKSFCALWNLRLVRHAGVTFLMDDQIPGYAAQDLLQAAGYRRLLLSPGKLFRYLDHIEAGTISAIGGYGTSHRRFRKYADILGRVA